MLAADGNVDSLGIDGLDHAAESHLLEVEDDVLHTLDNAGNGLELLVNSDNLDLGNRKTLERCKKNASESIADSLAVSGLKRTEFKAAHGIGAFEHDHLVGFLEC